jgi:hypothetical protein
LEQWAPEVQPWALVGVAECRCSEVQAELLLLEDEPSCAG